MSKALIYLGIAALGNFFYHLGQKFLPENANPMLLLAVVYAQSLLVCLAALPFFQKNAEAASLFSLAFDWRLWLVAVGVILIEIGFLLAYRSGGSIQWSGVAVNGAAALLLIPISVFFLKENLSLQKVSGIVFTLLGLYLLSQKS